MLGGLPQGMFGDQSEQGSEAGSGEEFSSAVLGSEESVSSPEPEAEDGVEALPEWADAVLALVAEGARLTAAQDRQVTLALDLRKERASRIAARQAQQAAAAAAAKAAETKAQTWMSDERAIAALLLSPPSVIALRPIRTCIVTLWKMCERPRSPEILLPTCT